MTEIPIGSKWKHKNSNDVYVVMEQYSHRVVLQHELTGTSIKLTIGHLNPDGFAEYERIEEPQPLGPTGSVGIVGPVGSYVNHNIKVK
jgi:hypothetical protein